MPQYHILSFLIDYATRNLRLSTYSASRAPNMSIINKYVGLEHSNGWEGYYPMQEGHCPYIRIMLQVITR